MALPGFARNQDAPEDPEYSICLRKWYTNDDEYASYGYVYLTIGEPTSKLDYCREMTMARGRILYEVADKDRDTIIGYLVLQETLAECNAHDPTKSISVWRHVAYDKRAALCHAYGSIIRRFPGLRAHPVSAKMMAEEFFRQASDRITPHGAEMIVVRYARDYFTSFKRRSSELGTLDAWEHIKLRMRSVLRNWLDNGLPEDEYLAFERRWELREMDDSDGEGDESTSCNRRQIGRLMDPFQ